MEILSLENKLGSLIQIFKPRKFSDDWGPIAADLRQAFVVFCATHKVYRGSKRLCNARAEGRRSDTWCRGCEEVNKALLQAKKEKAEKRASERLKREELRQRAIEEKNAPLDPITGLPWRKKIEIWETRVEMIDRIERNRAIAAEIDERQKAEGKAMPRWKVGRATTGKRSHSRVSKEPEEMVDLPYIRAINEACPSDELRAKLKGFKLA